jgi:hypothetical protein
MRINYLLLALVALTTVVGLYMIGSPDQAENLETVRREAAFSGEAREIVMMMLALGLGGFIAYLAITRR